MPLSFTDPDLTSGDEVTAAYYNQLVADIRAFFDAIAADPDLPAPIQLTRSRHHLDGVRNSLHSFRRVLGDSAQSDSQWRDAAGYGAATDGVTSSQTLLNSTISDIASTGGVVLLMPGIYSLTADWDITASGSGVIIIGFGSNTVIRQRNSANINDALINAQQGGDITLFGVRVEGNSAQNTTGECYGIDFRSVVNGLIIDCIVNDSTGHGIGVGHQDGAGGLVPVSGSFVYNTRATNCAKSGFYGDMEKTTPASSQILACQIVNCFAEGNGEHGIEVSRESMGFGVYGNQCHSNSKNGIAIAYNDTGTNESVGARIVGNICGNNSENGIQVGSNLVDTKNVSVLFNQAFGNLESGIKISGAADTSKCNYRGNICYENRLHGIAVDGGLGISDLNLRAWTGFESGDTEFDTNQFGGSSSPSVSNTQAKNGTYSMRINKVGAATSYFRLRMSDLDSGSVGGQITSTDGAYASFYMYIATAPSADEEPIFYFGTASGQLLEFRLNSSRQIEMWHLDGATSVVETGTTALSTATWHRVDVYYRYVSASEFEYSLYLNSTEEFSGTDTNSVSGNVASFVIGAASDRNSESYDIYFDDLVLGEGGWLTEPHKVTLSVPTSTVVEPLEWAKVGASTFHECVDEVIADDNTSYIHATTGTPTLDDQYILGFQSLTGLGLSDANIVRGIKVNWRINVQTATTQLDLYFLIGDGTTNPPGYKSDNMAYTTGTYLTKQFFFSGVPYDTSIRWTNELADLAQVGLIGPRNSSNFRFTQHNLHILTGNFNPRGDFLDFLVSKNVTFDNGMNGIHFENLSSQGSTTNSVAYGNSAFDSRDDEDVTQDYGIDVSGTGFTGVEVIGNAAVNNKTRGIRQAVVTNSGYDISHNQEENP